MTDVREPAVAGKFYEADPDRLRDQIEACYRHKSGPGRIPEISSTELRGPVGLLLPHAGYPYSGPVAAHGFAWLADQGKPGTAIIIGTNHSGRGASLAIDTQGEWRTPLGNVPIDSDIANTILDTYSNLEPSKAAFHNEHSIEVQLPFLQHIYGEDFKFVPLSLYAQDQDIALEIGQALNEVTGQDTVVVASSDFSHYEPQEVARDKDTDAIASILELDIASLYEKIEQRNISICGYGPIASLMHFASLRGMGCRRLMYATSGEVSGAGGNVVGYAALSFGGLTDG